MKFAQKLHTLRFQKNECVPTQRCAFFYDKFIDPKCVHVGYDSTLNVKLFHKYFFLCVFKAVTSLRIVKLMNFCVCWEREQVFEHLLMRSIKIKYC